MSVEDHTRRAANRVVSSPIVESAGVGRGESYAFAGVIFGLREEVTPQSEAMRLIADELYITCGRRGLRGVTVCAVASGEGVTFVAANLAVAMAAGGRRTLLVEANLRTPRLDALITPRDAPTAGLALFLADDRVLSADIVRHDVLPNLAVVYAGPPAGSANELLSTERFKDFVGESLRAYDLVIVDSPPANQSPDAIAIAATVGAALIVARHNFTFMDDIATLAQSLETAGAVIVGTTLNA